MAEELIKKESRKEDIISRVENSLLQEKIHGASYFHDKNNALLSLCELDIEQIKASVNEAKKLADKALPHEDENNLIQGERPL